VQPVLYGYARPLRVT